MGKRGKRDENKWLARCRAATGWTPEEAHRHDAEERVSEKGVGDFVLPAPVVVQLRALKDPRPWDALADARAAAEGTGQHPVAGLVVKRGRGRKRYRLVGMGRETHLWLTRATAVAVPVMRAERHGLEAAYEEMLEGLGAGVGELGAAFVMQKRGGEQTMVVMEEHRFHHMLSVGWGREEPTAEQEGTR